MPALDVLEAPSKSRSVKPAAPSPAPAIDRTPRTRQRRSPTPDVFTGNAIVEDRREHLIFTANGLAG